MRRLVVLICVAVMLIFLPALSGAADKAAAEESYQQALRQLQGGNAGEAYTLLGNLEKENGKTDQYEIGIINALLDLSMREKEKGGDTWKSKAQEAAIKIKTLRYSNSANPDYLLVYAKYCALVDKERGVERSLEKAFYYKPNFGEGHIAKGESFFCLAVNTNPNEKKNTSSSVTGSQEDYTRHWRGMEAKEAFDKALASPDLSAERKAYVYYQLARLDMKVLADDERAKTTLQKSIDAAPESVAAGNARALLGTLK